MRSFVWLLVIGCVLFAISAAYADIVVPGAYTGVNGGNQALPFDANANSVRYQQVYAASEFPTIPILITGIAFRPNYLIAPTHDLGVPFSTVLSNVQIDLSTTTKAPGGLSVTFANNVGSDVTTVRSGALPLSSSFTGPPCGGQGYCGPKNFDIVINFTTPFLYNPQQGNLLLDVRNFGGGASNVFDNASTPSVSQVYAYG